MPPPPAVREWRAAAMRACVCMGGWVAGGGCGGHARWGAAAACMADPDSDELRSDAILFGPVALVVVREQGVRAGQREVGPETRALRHRLAVRGPGRKYGTVVSGWQQQLVSRIGVPDHAQPHSVVGAANSHSSTLCTATGGGGGRSQNVWQGSSGAVLRTKAS